MSSAIFDENTSQKTDLGLQTVLGTIQPCSHNNQRVALFENDTDKEFCILPKGAGADLIDCVSEYMQIKGIVTKISSPDEDAQYTILVRSYNAQDEF